MGGHGAGFRVADHEAVALEVGEGADETALGVTKARGNSSRRWRGLTPEQLPDFHTGGTAGEGGGQSGRWPAMLAQPQVFITGES